MVFKIFCRLSPLAHHMKPPPAAFTASRTGSGHPLTVKHDRANRRFTVAPGGGAEDGDCAVLTYKLSGEREVELLSTFVPETFRGHGVAALLSQAALDFVVEDDLKARVSCWYIKKYLEDDGRQKYKHLLVN